jgi:predicted Zn-dependent protease
LSWPCKATPRAFVAVVLSVALSGCITNPVTGKREIGWVSDESAIRIGTEQYGPSQQMQGGVYEVDPALTPYVARVGKRVAAQTQVNLPYEFVVLNNSVPNAWALPGGKIAVNRGLLIELNNEAELAAVLGHEATHAAARHGAQRIERATLLQVGMLAAAIGASGTQYGNAVVGASQLGAQLITQKYGRDAEREADYYGTEFMAKAGYDPHAAVTLQETFVRLAGEKRDDWLSGLFASHPPSQERVVNNRARAAELGAGGELGKESFDRAMRYLRSKKEAYAAFDEAHKLAAKKGGMTQALAAVDRAIAIEPKDASFYGLKGDLLLKKKSYADAVKQYDRAIAIDDGLFSYYLGRGIANARLKSPAAKADLEQSAKLLPTAVAYNELGRIAEGARDIDTALRYYRVAAQSESPVGAAASARLVVLDLPRNPSAYVRAEVGVVEGRPALAVTNLTSVPLEDVAVRVQLQWADGRIEEGTRGVRRLDPGGRVLVALPVRDVALAGGKAIATGASVGESDSE